MKCDPASVCEPWASASALSLPCPGVPAHLGHYRHCSAGAGLLSETAACRALIVMGNTARMENGQRCCGRAFGWG